MAAPPSFASQAPSSMAKASETPRSTRSESSKLHITETPITKANWYKHVNWLNVFFIIGIPLMGCVTAFWTPLQWKTAVFAVVYYFMTGLGITAGKSMLRMELSSSDQHTNIPP